MGGLIWPHYFAIILKYYYLHPSSVAVQLRTALESEFRCRTGCLLKVSPWNHSSNSSTDSSGPSLQPVCHTSGYTSHFADLNSNTASKQQCHWNNEITESDLGVICVNGFVLASDLASFIFMSKYSFIHVYQLYSDALLFRKLSQAITKNCPP